MCGPLKATGSSALMRGCKHLRHLSFDCFDWSRCIASYSWDNLPVPPREITSQGTENVFEFVKAVLQGGDIRIRSCRVMVVGPQMVRSHSSIVDSALTTTTGWEDQLDQGSTGRLVSIHTRQSSNSCPANHSAAVR
jgi:hypothetical protein